MKKLFFFLFCLSLSACDIKELENVDADTDTSADASADADIDLKADSTDDNAHPTDVCPPNFVDVPHLADYTTKDFCVAKYEMKKDDSDNAVSRAKSQPWVSITRDNAIDRCTDMGTGYDLITNDEWQTMARNIELVGSNWDGGKVGSVGMNQGHNDDYPNVALSAPENSDDGCSYTKNKCNKNGWHAQRRTHHLSNGQVIWDAGGNVVEWVKDSSRNTDYKHGGYVMLFNPQKNPSAIYALSGGITTTPRNAKGQFGPKGTYRIFTGVYGGLGTWSLSITNINADGKIRRGGFFRFNSSGLFGTIFWSPYQSTYGVANAYVGFRCVYHPY